MVWHLTLWFVFWEMRRSPNIELGTQLFCAGWGGAEARFRGWAVHTRALSRLESSQRTAPGLSPPDRTLWNQENWGNTVEPHCDSHQGSLSFWKQAVSFWQTNNSSQILPVTAFCFSSAPGHKRSEAQFLDENINPGAKPVTRDRSHSYFLCLMLGSF